MQALPPGKTMADKYFIGFFKDGILCAVMDIITGYPDKETAFIGLFMLEKDLQGKGIASKIIKESCTYFKLIGFSRVMLGYAKGNPQSRAFWEKNEFKKTGDETQADGYIIVKMQRQL